MVGSPPHAQACGSRPSFCSSSRAAATGSPRTGSVAKGDAICKRVNARIAKQPDPQVRLRPQGPRERTSKIYNPAIEQHGGARPAEVQATSPTSRSSSRASSASAISPSRSATAAGARTRPRSRRPAPTREKVQQEHRRLTAGSGSRNAEGVSDMARIGVLTGGGDCPGLNAVIRAHRAQGRRPARPRVRRLPLRLGGRARRRRRSSSRRRRRAASCTAAGRSSAPRARTRTRRTDGARARARVAASAGVDALIPIGGEDTLGVARRAGRATACTSSASRRRSTTTSRDRLHLRLPDRGADRDRRDRPAAHDRRVAQPRDRRRGDGAPRGLDRRLLRAWPAAPTSILVPERPFDIEEVCDRLRRRHEHGRTFSIVVVAEGATPARRRRCRAQAGRPTRSATCASAASRRSSSARSSSAPASRRA